MLSASFLIAVSLSVGVRGVTPEQAAFSAKTFLKAVGVPQPLKLVSARLNRAYSGIGGSPIYIVALTKPGSSVQLNVSVDSSSGDVIYAADPQFQPGASLGDPALTDKWMARLGFQAKRIDQGRYTGTVAGYRFINLNGKTTTTWLTNKGKFAFYDGFGSLPPLPSGKPKMITEKQAISIGIAERKKTVPKWPESLEAKAELGLFYDQRQSKTIWVWYIAEGKTVTGKFRESFIEYVEAATGKVIDKDYITASTYAYHPRTRKPLLEGAGPTANESRLLRLARARLADIGRQDVKFDEVKLGDGIRMSTRFDVLLEVGPTGQLITFKAPTGPGMLGFTKAKAKGTALVKKLHPVLPEGRFRVEKSRLGNFAATIYGQTALGYDYLESEVVSVHFNKTGTIARFLSYAPKPRPIGLPAKILTPKQMESYAYKRIAPSIPKSTPKVRYYAQVKAGKIGWYYVPKLKKTRLCRYMSIGMMRDIKDYAIQGGGTICKMDVETGTIYGYP